LFRPEVVRQRDSTEAIAVGGNGGVLRQFVPRVERESRRAVAQEETDPVVVLLLNGPPETLAVKRPRPFQVSDAERDHGYVRLHYQPWTTRASEASTATTPRRL